MKRGDVFLVGAPGEHGNIRPAVILQSDYFNESDLDTVIVVLMTTTKRDAPLIRIAIAPNEDNGLSETSYLMVDKTMALSRARIRDRVGRLNEEQLATLGRSMALLLGLAE